MYKNLLAEMARNNINRYDIARTIGRSYNHTREKILGRYDFELGEALKIKNTHFPDLPLEYLFEKTEV